MALLVVGSVAYDSVETAHGKVDRALGGSATFFSMTSALWTPTHVVAVVGEDFRDSDLERMRQRGVDVTGVDRVPGETFRWGGVYSQHFETRTTLFTELNVFAGFKPGIPASQRAADFVFLGDSLLAIPRAIRASRVTMAVVRQNFVLAIGYNVLAVPLAMAGMVTPLVAAIAMSTSSLIVIANSLRLVRAAK